jgi:hypothetical protein
MKFPFPTRRPRLQFTLRTLFIFITLVALWLGYYANWAHQRREARKWFDAHADDIGGSVIIDDDWPMPPWPLRLFGEDPMHARSVKPLESDRQDLAAYRVRVEKMASLFPECMIIERPENTGSEPVKD